MQFTTLSFFISSVIGSDVSNEQMFVSVEQSSEGLLVVVGTMSVVDSEGVVLSETVVEGSAVVGIGRFVGCGPEPHNSLPLNITEVNSGCSLPEKDA